MSLQRTRGIVLKTAPHGEADKIITLYSDTLGLVTGIAKGAQKSKKRFVNKLEEFTELQILYRPARNPAGLFFLSEAELLNAHLWLRTIYGHYLCAMYASELMLRYTREASPDPFLFSLLQWVYRALPRSESPITAMLLYHLHLLGAAGYSPQLTACSRCNKTVSPGQTFVLSAHTGSLLCNHCQPTETTQQAQLTVQTLRFLAKGQQTELTRLNRLRLSSQAAWNALTSLHYYSLALLQQDIHSWGQLTNSKSFL